MQNVCLDDSPINNDLLCRYVAHDNSSLAALIRVVGKTPTTVASREELAEAAGLTFQQTRDALDKLKKLPAFQVQRVQDDVRVCLQVRVIERLLPTMPSSIDWTKHKKLAPWKKPYTPRKSKPKPKPKSVRLPKANGLPFEDKDLRDALCDLGKKRPNNLRFDMRDALKAGDACAASLILSVIVRKLPLKQVRAHLDPADDWLLDPEKVGQRALYDETVISDTYHLLGTCFCTMPDGRKRKLGPPLDFLLGALKRQIGAPVKNGTTPVKK